MTPPLSPRLTTCLRTMEFPFSAPEIRSLILFLPGYASLNKRL